MEGDAPLDRSKTLLALCGDDLEEFQEELPLSLLNKPVRKLRAGELHHLLIHNIAPVVTVPLSLDVLRRDPFVEAQGQPGDLLVALLETSTQFWLEHQEYWLEACEVLQEAIAGITARAEQEDRGDYMPFYVGDDFMAAVVHFRSLFSIEEEEES